MCIRLHLKKSFHSFTFVPLLCCCHCTPQGSHYYFEGVKLAQGRDNVLVHLKDNPDTAARITQALKVKMAQDAAGRASSGAKAGSSSDLDFDEFEEELLDDDALLEDLGKQIQ